jgi:hypothetical protein
MYQPVLGESQHYAGTIETEPWQLGHGTWVVHLREMNAAYQERFGRDRVRAVAFEFLSEPPRAQVIDLYEALKRSLKESEE